MNGNEFYWFMAVVECTLDPEKLGRVKARVLGDHTQNKELIPTDDLPWAMPMMPVTSASMNGIGQSPLGLVNGSLVMGFYRDGADKQQPIIMGSFCGLPLDPPIGDIGFNDPTECFPQVPKLEEPDTNRHARGVVGKYVIEPVPVTVRRDSVMEGFATGASQWSEPETPYNPIYPYNYSWEGPYNPKCDTCEWGHLEEWDSTPGHERYFRQHKTSQNFLEIHPDGKEVRKIYGDGFEIDLGSKHLYVEGDYRVTINGNKDEHIKGDLWQHIEGNHVQVIDKDKSCTILGKDSTTVHEEVIRRSKKDIFDVTEKNLVRMANETINDSSGQKITALTVDDITIGIGSYSPVAVNDVPPITVDSDAMPNVTLSCKEMNQAIVSEPNIITPKIPDFDVNSSSVADTQIKIVPTTIYLDSLYTHILSENFIKEDTHFSKNVRIKVDLDVEEDVSIGGQVNILQDVYTGADVHITENIFVGGTANALGDVIAGGNVEVGDELHALHPMAIDPVVEHEYLVPTGAAAPTAPIDPDDPTPADPFVIPEKAVIDKVIVIPEEVYSPNDKVPVPTIPGEAIRCE